MDYILAIDPGGTTGLCGATWDGNDLILTPDERRMTVLDLHNMLKECRKFTENGWNVYVVYETFEFRNAARTGLDLTPCKLIGIIELHELKYGSEIEFKDQSPGAQSDSAFFSDKQLKRMGIYWPHGAGHARSATKHLMYFMQFGAGGRLGWKPHMPIRMKDLRAK